MIMYNYKITGKTNMTYGNFTIKYTQNLNFHKRFSFMFTDIAILQVSGFISKLPVIYFSVDHKSTGVN
jgi:hypothetical protein